MLLIYGLTSGNIIGWDSEAVIGTIVAAVVLLVGFIFVEARIASNPLVPRHLWTVAELAGGCGLAALTYAVWQGANYFLTIQLQGTRPLQSSNVYR